MQWYEEILDDMDDQKVFSHKMLIDELKRLKPDLSDNTYHWALSSLVRMGSLTRLGYDSYKFSIDDAKQVYVPYYSEISLGLIKLISEQFPFIRFTVFETVLMNEYLNHQIAQNTIFVQIEKEYSICIFQFLQDNEFMHLLYKPSRKEFDLYWSKDCIVVTDLISEAPLRRIEPHAIMLEKMLVDMVADRLIASTFSPAELPDVCTDVQHRYLIDRVRMMRYARRRNKQKVFMKYFVEEK